MNCDRARKELTTKPTRGEGLTSHLADCEECARFAERFELAAETLRDHHSVVLPDPAFARRVVARLPAMEPTLGWAAWRMLPAAAALLLVLSAWTWIGTATPSELIVSSPTDDLISWVLESEEAGE